jgi:hypothetical protein
MKNRITPNIAPAMVVFATAAAVALRVAVGQSEPPRGHETGSSPVTVTVDDSGAQPAAPNGTRGGARDEMVGPPGPPGRPVSAVDQRQDIFHELHADGRNAACAVCDSQYRSA